MTFCGLKAALLCAGGNAKMRQSAAGASIDGPVSRSRHLPRMVLVWGIAGLDRLGAGQLSSTAAIGQD